MPEGQLVIYRIEFATKQTSLERTNYYTGSTSDIIFKSFKGSGVGTYLCLREQLT